MEVFSDPMQVEVLTGLAGLKSLDVIRILRTRGEISDYDLAQMMGMSWNKARGILYKLNNKNVVKSEKKTDKKTGKTMYFWTLDEDKLYNLLIERRKETLSILKKKLEFEQENNFYTCKAGCKKLYFEQAMEQEFMCPICKEPLEFHDNTMTIEEISSYIQHIEESIVVLT